jgi:hypothetical protein
MLPETPVLRQVAKGYAEVLSKLELERGEQPVVLPNGEWFPDTFKGDLESLQRLLCRMQGYAGLEATEIEVRFSGDEIGEGAGCAPAKASSCGSCAPSVPGADAVGLERTSDGFVVTLPPTIVSHPLVMTSTVARMLGAIRLAEAGESNPTAAQAELSAVSLGFGVLLLEASYVYAKSCGGPSVTKLTALGCGELSFAFSLFLATEGHQLGGAKKELSTTQRATIDEAWALVGSNKKLVERLQRDPDAVVADRFELGEAHSWLASVLGFGKKKKPADPAAAALEALERGEDVEQIAALFENGSASKSGSSSNGATSQTPKQRPARPRDDVSDLVDEALREMRG